MKKYFILFLFTLALFAFSKNMDAGNSQAAIKDAVSKSLPLLQSSSHKFLTNSFSCHSCHNQGLGVVAFSLARARGFNCDSSQQEAVDSTLNYFKGYQFRQAFAENDDPVAIVMTGNYDLWGLSASHYKSNKVIAQLAVNIMRKQSYDGRWVSPGQRPPLEYYDISATALSVKNIQDYVPAAWKTEVGERVAKAREWLLHVVPETNEERVFQLLGLSWCGGDKRFLAQQAAALLATQQSNGGWSQLDSLPADAYGTGQALYALHESGNLAISAAAYQKGIKFLIDTQYPDGSWKVVTRSYPFVPYVASGFPHDKNEFISAAGSNWAVMALLAAMQ